MVLEVQDSGCAEEVVTNHWREIRGTSGMLVIVFLICVHVGGVCFHFENLSGCNFDLCTFL